MDEHGLQGRFRQMQRLKARKLMALLCILGIVLHALLFIGLHFLEPQVNPIASIISEYAATRHGWLASAAYFSFGIVWLATSAIVLGLPRRAIHLLAGALFFVASVGVLISGISPVVSDPRESSGWMLLENFVGRIARPSLFLGLLTASAGLLGVPEWRSIARILVSLASAIIVVFIVTLAFLLNNGLGGLGQRAIFLMIYAWVVLFAGCALRSKEFS